MTIRYLMYGLRQIDQVAVLELQGIVDAGIRSYLEQAFRAAIMAGVSAMIFDFSRVTYFNSTGLSIFIRLAGEHHRSGLVLFGCGLNDHYQDIFRLMRLDEIIHLYAHQAEAIASAQASMDTTNSNSESTLSS